MFANCCLIYSFYMKNLLKINKMNSIRFASVIGRYGRNNFISHFEQNNMYFQRHRNSDVCNVFASKIHKTVWNFKFQIDKTVKIFWEPYLRRQFSVVVLILARRKERRWSLSDQNKHYNFSIRSPTANGKINIFRRLRCSWDFVSVFAFHMYTAYLWLWYDGPTLT